MSDFCVFGACVRNLLGPGLGPGPGAWVRKYISNYFAYNGIEKGGLLCRRKERSVRLERAQGEQTRTPVLHRKLCPPKAPAAYGHVLSVVPYCVNWSLYRVLNGASMST